MKARDLVEVFHAGKMVANPKAWKAGTVTVNTILVLISGGLGIMHMFDCSFCGIELSAEQQLNIAMGIITFAGIFNTGSTVATTDKIGFTPKDVKPVDADLEKDLKDLQ